MPCTFSIDPNTKSGTLEFHKGGQVVTTRVINGNTVNFDSGGVMVSAVFPNALATMNLAGLPFEQGDHEHVVQMMKHYNIKTGG